HDLVLSSLRAGRPASQQDGDCRPGLAPADRRDRGGERGTESVPQPTGRARAIAGEAPPPAQTAESAQTDASSGKCAAGAGRAEGPAGRNETAAPDRFR